MVVDDDELVLTALREALEDEGCEIETASSGIIAREKATAEKFDLIFTDLIMPGLNGVQLCQGVKKVFPDTQVVLISGHPAEVAQQSSSFLEAGGYQTILHKPLSIHEIIATIKKLITM